MYNFVCRRLVISQVLTNSCKSVVKDLAKTQMALCSSLVLPISIRSFFSTESEQVKAEHPEEYSFAVSYLINSCGLSPETAKSVSGKINFQSADRPDLVLRMLRNHGFTITHIAKLVKLRPHLLLADAEKTIFPKLEFFKSIGVTDAELASVCCATPAILAQSTNNVLIPNYNFLKSVLLSDENVVKVFRKKSWIFLQDSQKTVSQKLAVFRELGVPESFFPVILTCYTHILLQRTEKFEDNVKKVLNMGFDPRKFVFIHAMQVFTSFCQSTWERKSDVFRRWGWSDDDIMLAFRRSPSFMNASEEKITNGMDFLVNKMGWQSTNITIYPGVFLLSLENRVIPRCLVFKVLQSKGLVKRNMSLGTFLKPSEKLFLDKFVTKHIHIVPQLLDIYQRKEGVEVLNNHI
ncbi:hypothetical protein ACOSP7_000340 [Xanthoceras sorbifolium]